MLAPSLRRAATLHPYASACRYSQQQTKPLAIFRSGRIYSALRTSHTRSRAQTGLGFFSYKSEPGRKDRALAHRIYVQSSATFTSVGASLAVAAAIYIAWLYTRDSTTSTGGAESQTAKSVKASDTPSILRVYPGMGAEILPGRPGNLTAEQEEKLKELWRALFSLQEVYQRQASIDANGDAVRPSTPASSTAPSQTDSPDSGKKKRRFGGLLGRGKKDAPTTDPDEMQHTDDKYGQTKEYKAALAAMTPAELRENMWYLVKADDPDAVLLRYLRARKWDVQKALVMMVSTVHWRGKTINLDEDVIFNGEQGMLEAEGGNPPHPIPSSRLGEDFMSQIRQGKSYLHGEDKDGRPLTVVRARLHHAGDQSEEALERFTVFTIETARFMLRPPVDTCTIVFDLTDFSLSNMDYAPVKFMIKVFEANFPESLGHILVHKAPWVFSSIWAIIKGWLDPVVAGKVHFTKNAKDLSQYVDMARVPKELGGDEDWEYSYVEPVPGENDAMKDADTRKKLNEERRRVVDEYEAETIKWCKGDGDDEELQARRLHLAERLRECYWRLDPYVRARSLYDRIGVIGKNGEVNMYPGDHQKAAQNGASNGLLVPGGGKDADAASIGGNSVYYDAMEDLD